MLKKLVRNSCSWSDPFGFLAVTEMQTARNASYTEISSTRRDTGGTLAWQPDEHRPLTKAAEMAAVYWDLRTSHQSHPEQKKTCKTCQGWGKCEKTKLSIFRQSISTRQHAQFLTGML
jgi:hypothetical protein